METQFSETNIQSKRKENRKKEKSNGACSCVVHVVMGVDAIICWFSKKKFNGGFKSSSSSLASVATGAAGRSIQAEARLETPLSQA